RWVGGRGLAGVAACSSGAGAPRAERALPERITVSSPAFAAGAAIPQRFTCQGENVSPPLGWSGVAAGTAEREGPLPDGITVSSPAFAAGAAIPQRFTCQGENVSPPLGWSGVAAGTAE